MQPIEFRERAAMLRRQGFTPGEPPGTPETEAAWNARLCSVSECTRCGGKGLGYAPYHNGKRYRVLSRCPLCGHTTDSGDGAVIEEAVQS